MLIFIAFILAGLAFATTALNELAHSGSYAPTHDLLKEHDLLDIVLVASVDGKLHALNRSSGHALWSMSSFATTTSVSAPSSLSPLVRSPSSHDPDDDDEPETYLIEPQSGHIYVLHNPSSPLQRFPFSMAELVDLSPFTSTPMDGEQTRVFVGRKETSLLLIELETGKIKATLNSECPPIFDSDKPLRKDNDDEDEDEDDKTQISAPTEVYIGRTGDYLFFFFRHNVLIPKTDYHISIYRKPLPGHPAPPSQNLSFSTYGPNNKDNHLQTIYRRTKDDSYLQSLPNGEVISFRVMKADDTTRTSANRGGRPIWGHSFSAPMWFFFSLSFLDHN
jgi:serine/threonine-protein kinase/endoribonuclease IRE1